MVRGIENVTGVSCHISCTLQVLYYTLEPLIEVLREENKKGHKRRDGALLLSELSKFVRSLDDDASSDATSSFNPTSLYQALSKETSLDPNDVGDASTAMSKILQAIRNEGSDWSLLLDKCCGGETSQIIQGRRKDGDAVVLRTKQGKRKAMACPFPLTGQKNITSVESALQSAFAPARVHGYNWEKANPSSYEEERTTIPIADGGDDDDVENATTEYKEWETTKQLHLERCPNFWFIHLERFRYYDADVKTLSNAEIEVPLSISSILQKDDEEESPGSLNLKGGVVHVSEDSIEEEGHYVSVICDVNGNWFLIDDEVSTPLDQQRAIDLLGGTTDDESGKFYCATLLAYASEKIKDNTDILELVEKLKLQVAEETAQADLADAALVGRRLRVKWAKGKFYAGVVESFDLATGKHRVKYDDGDVKDYILAKKTVEWL